MTQPLDVAGGRNVVAHWCAFAEQRLEYLTELFETGRWRRYHTELAFLQNIQEAKTAVELWRTLAKREAARDNGAIDVSWLARASTTLPREDRRRGQGRSVAPPTAKMPGSSSAQSVAVAAQPNRIARKAFTAQSSAAPVPNDGPERVRNSDAISKRYPLLKNTL